MERIGVHLIFGSNPEPFLEAALRSVEWADYFCCINTAPDDGVAQRNEMIVRNTVPRDKLRLARIWMNPFNFSRARNECLKLADTGDYVLILDSDDVHYPEFEQIARGAVESGYDMITAHFWHLIGYKDLWGQEPHREILFTKTEETRFTKEVHEGLEHPRREPHLLPDYHYVHYGYIKPNREIFKRWVLYSELEGDPNHYAGRNPDDALAGWLDNTNPFWREHPPAVCGVLEAYPTAPRSARALPEGIPRNVGLVLLTWNDAENLRTCLKTLALTRQPFKLCVVDNGSDAETRKLLLDFTRDRVGYDGDDIIFFEPGHSLAEALNIGFGHWMSDPEIDYIGWVHPDMIFERDTWLECLRHALDVHPDIVKVGAYELGQPRIAEPWSGNSQCYLIRKTALQQVGLFNEEFEACGGYEDWEHNYRLAQIGRVMIWPDAIIRHNAMGTRSKHDNVEAGRRNADLYFQLVGQWGPVV